MEPSSSITSLSIWSIGVAIFLLHWGVFFDDFIGCETPVLSKLFELCADGLFMILGWTTAADKGAVAPCFQGRCITDRSCYTWHLYVDASNDNEKAGIGGILLSEAGSYIGHFSEYLDESAKGILNTSESENPIFELECFAIWCGIWTWARLFRNTQVIIFTDNEGALYSMVNGRSTNDAGSRIVSSTHRLLDEHFVNSWFERVNTFSNLADEPSRGISKTEWGARAAIDCDRLAQMAIGSG
ncbi:unnamed protein product, partial [Symbiodinium sp. CCMP2456]